MVWKPLWHPHEVRLDAAGTVVRARTLVENPTVYVALGGDPAALQGYNAGQPGAGDPGEDLAALSRPELQARAKAAGVPANLKSVEIIRRLQEQRSSSPGKWADK